MGRDATTGDWRDQSPPHPAELFEEYIERLGGMSQEKLSSQLKVRRETVNRLLRRRQAVSSEMALRLERLTGISAESWLSLQMQFDLFHARREHWGEIVEIEPLPAPDMPKPAA